MYRPAAFRIDDRPTLLAFLEQNSFATLITHHGGETLASHVPVLADREGNALHLHLAKANPQAAHLRAGAEALCVFHGPHSYISPSWYAVSPAVPTWNYAAVHAYGRPTPLNGEQLLKMLGEMVSRYEQGRLKPWSFDPALEWNRHMLAAIDGFSIEIARLEGKFKMSQNRGAEDRAGVIAALTASENPMDREVAALIAGLNPKPGA